MKIVPMFALIVICFLFLLLESDMLGFQSASPITLKTIPAQGEIVKGYQQPLLNSDSTYSITFDRTKIAQLIERAVTGKYDVHSDSYESIDEHTYRVREKMVIENRPWQENCPPNDFGYNTDSSQFHCVYFNDTVLPVGRENPKTKDVRVFWFDDYCSPQIDVNIQTGETKKRSFTKCTLYSFSPEELEFIEDYYKAGVFEADHLKRSVFRPENGTRWLCVPNIFLIGHPKVGSSTFYATLKEHSQVAPINRFYKEPQFFTHPGEKMDLPSLDPVAYLQFQCPIDFMINQDMIDNAMKYAEEHNTVPTICTPRQCADYSTRYTHLYPSYTYDNIHDTIPDAHIVTLYREPIARLVSEWNMMKQNLNIHDTVQHSILKMNEVFCKASRPKEAECIKTRADQVVEDRALPFFQPDEVFDILNLEEQKLQSFIFHTLYGHGYGIGKGFYWDIHRFLRDRFPENRLLSLFSEKLYAEDSASEWNRIYDFLGIEREELEIIHLNLSDKLFHREDLGDMIPILEEVYRFHAQVLLEELNLSKEDLPSNWSQ